VLAPFSVKGAQAVILIMHMNHNQFLIFGDIGVHIRTLAIVVCETWACGVVPVGLDQKVTYSGADRPPFESKLHIAKILDFLMGRKALYLRAFL